jgi:hypothetical protein
VIVPKLGILFLARPENKHINLTNFPSRGEHIRNVNEFETDHPLASVEHMLVNRRVALVLVLVLWACTLPYVRTKNLIIEATLKQIFHLFIIRKNRPCYTLDLTSYLKLFIN